MINDPFTNDRLANKLEYYLETNLNADIFNLIEFIYLNTENLKERLYLTKYLLNSNKSLMTNLQYFLTLEQDKKNESIEHLKGLYYNPETLENYMNTSIKKGKNKSEHINILTKFFTELYQNNIEFLKTEIESIELEIESSDYAFGSEDQQKQPDQQPDKIVLKRGRKKDSDLEKRIIVLDRLETALKLKEKGHKLYLQENYHSTLTRDFKYFYDNISKAKDKLSKLKIEDIEKAKPKK